MMLLNADKALAHFSLVVVDEANETHLAERLERRIASMESVFQRVAAMTSMLDL
jgi:transposase-like protein